MNRPIKVKIWVKFLKEHGFSPNRQRGTSHLVYKKPGHPRSIPVRAQKKEISIHEIRQSLKTVGVSLPEFENWLELNG